MEGGHLLLPGTTAEIGHGTVDDLTHPMSDAEIETIFLDKERYLRDFAERARPAIEAQKAQWAAPQPDILRQLKERIEPLMKRADHGATASAARSAWTCTACPRTPPGSTRMHAVAGVRLHRPRDSASTTADQARYRWGMPATLVQQQHRHRRGRLVELAVPVGALHRSARGSVQRVPLDLSEERMDYVEHRYDAQNDDVAGRRRSARRTSSRRSPSAPRTDT